MRDRSDPVEDRASLRERLFDVPNDVPRPAWYGRMALLAVVAIWATSVLLSRMTEPQTVLHLTVILFHEAGHVIFMPFGEAVRVAGGTLGQLLMPFICAVALHRRGDNFGAAICFAWMGMSLMDASVHAYDAADPLLPLIGGGTGSDSFHDFVFLFERYGQLGHARGWGMAMKALGAVTVYASLAWAAVLLFLQSEQLEDR